MPESRLHGLRNSLLLGLQSLDVMYSKVGGRNIKRVLASTNKDFRTIQAIISRYEKQKNPLVQDYIMFVTRASIIHLYEMCKESIHYKKIKTQDWFVYLANLRHAFAHGVRGHWRITFYGKKHIVYTRQCDMHNFILNPHRDNTIIKQEQYGGLLTVRDLMHYVELHILR